jgi:phosphoglycerate kinase
MINLPKLENLDIVGKRILIRADVDLPDEALAKSGVTPLRLQILKKTCDFILSKSPAKIIVIGHRGRPEGKKNPDLSLSSVAVKLSELMGKVIDFEQDKGSNILMLENLRFDPREEANDVGFAKELAYLGDVYVNEAFAASHREHASVVELPKQFKFKSKNSVAAGLRFKEEIENLSKVFESPKRPVVVLISGVKEDKLSYIEPFSQFADKILVAGRLPEYLEINTNNTNFKFPIPNEKLVIAQLNPDKEDVTIHSIERFEAEIAKAGTIVLAGPIGKYEEEGHRLGTKRVFDAVANSSAFKIAGGGDTEEAIALLGLEGKFDWISVGGGAMLEFLAKRTLLGIEALIS